MPRDEFSAETKTILAKRAAYRCSKPSCRIMTVGPSRESPESVASVGIAAHMSAAAEGGPRYDATLESASRSSLHNGIWLCATHATLIDRDVERFPIALLREWKDQHEAFVATYLGESEIAVARADVELSGRRISSDAARILIERAPFWEHVLLAQLLRDELETLKDDALDLRYGVAVGACRIVSASQVLSELRSSSEQSLALLEAANVLLGKPTADAIGPPGVEGDPEIVAYVAARLGGIYKSAIAEGMKWLHTRSTWEAARKLIRLTSRLSISVLDGIDRFPSQIDDAMLFAQSYVGEEVVTQTVTVAFTIDDELREQLDAEIERLSKLVRP